MTSFSALVKEEERRRLACWAPTERWRAIQATLSWAEQQQAIPRNSKAACIARQKRVMGMICAQQSQRS